MIQIYCIVCDCMLKYIQYMPIILNAMCVDNLPQTVDIRQRPIGHGNVQSTQLFIG